MEADAAARRVDRSAGPYVYARPRARRAANRWEAPLGCAQRLWRAQRLDSTVNPGTSHPLRRHVVGRQPPVRRELLHELGKVPAQVGDHLVAWHADLLRPRVDVVDPGGTSELIRLERLICPMADP